MLLFFLILNVIIACESTIFRQLNINPTSAFKPFLNFDQLNKYLDFFNGDNQTLGQSLFLSTNSKLINQRDKLQPKTRLNGSPQKIQLHNILNENWLRNSTLFNYEVDLTKPLPLPYFGQTSEPDLKMNVPEMIKFRNFIPETHQVITKDCYILKIHRIINPKLKNVPNKRPILMQHGLMGTSADFLMNSLGGNLDDKDNRNLAFYLSKLGYDVWLANSRGNVYSTNHTTLNPNKQKLYWQFSFDEMASFDLPSTIAYIQNYTKIDTIGYIGHSQGTLILFQLLAAQPKLEKFIRPIIALAPVARVTNVRTPIKFLSYNNQLMKNFLKNYDSYLNLKTAKPNLLSDLFCRDRFEFFCKNMLFLLGGFDTKQLNTTRLPVYANNFPAGTSTWNILHYGQMVRDKKAQYFNYETREDNIRCYGREFPPEIELSKIRSLYINLIYSENDWLADMDDVQYLRSNLKVKYNEHKIPFKEWNHFDFLIGKDTDVYVNNVVVNMLLNYENIEMKKNENITSNINTENNLSKLTIYNSQTCSLSNKCFLLN